MENTVAEATVRGCWAVANGRLLVGIRLAWYGVFKELSSGALLNIPACLVAAGKFAKFFAKSSFYHNSEHITIYN